MDQGSRPLAKTLPHGRALSLRTWLALAICVAVLPLLAVLVGGSLGRYHADHARAGQHTQELARGMADLVGRELRSLMTGLRCWRNPGRIGTVEPTPGGSG